MKLINLLIKELDKCSFGGDFRVSRHAEICQFDRSSLEINFKRARSCNYGIPILVQVKMKVLYMFLPRCFFHKINPVLTNCRKPTSPTNGAFGQVKEN